jgi:PPK2 family polyphosphate:nucleotide phosphotransferase
MNEKKLIRKSSDLAENFRVTKGAKFRLKDCDPAETHVLKSPEQAAELLRHCAERLGDLQEKLYAQSQWAVLVIFQGMDAAGKDGAIKHVMSGVNPQGCDVWPFKTPSNEELNHDYLWRAHKCVPERGKIGIFNRSYYEEVLVVRVHQGLLNKEKLPDGLVSKEIWEERYDEINAFEKYLSNNGVTIVKFFLHLSKKEQKRRFLERLEDWRKNWKFSMADIEERQYWRDYQTAYEEMIRGTATKRAPWYVVPADNKWFARVVVAAAINETLEGPKLKFPDADEAKKKELNRVKKVLLGRNG